MAFNKRCWNTSLLMTKLAPRSARAKGEVASFKNASISSIALVVFDLVDWESSKSLSESEYLGRLALGGGGSCPSPRQNRSIWRPQQEGDAKHQ